MADDLLKRFMQEHFPYAEFKKAGLFTKEMRGNYEAQAQWICNWLNLKTVYEYGAIEIRCHVSYGGSISGMGSERPLHINESGELKEEPFITIIPSIYE